MTVAMMKCACSSDMLVEGTGVGWCENCDRVQPQQNFGVARSKTSQDIQFEMRWLRRMAEYYPAKPPETSEGENDD